MPEFKHQFTGGKMNKDLDERLVPVEDYRDAMNIQVSTSDGSDVGVVQNILGNSIGCTDSSGSIDLTSYIPTLTSKVIGSISDEKNDSFYWFISGLSTNSTITSTDVWGMYQHLETVDSSWRTKVDSTNTYLFKDLIVGANIKHIGLDGRSITNAECKPVLTDIYGFCVKNQNPEDIISSFSLDEDLAALVNENWVVASYNDTGITSTTAVSNIIASDGLVPFVPTIAQNTSPWNVDGLFQSVGFGISSPTGSATDWNYKGDIYVLRTSQGGVFGSNTEPMVGDRIEGFQINANNAYSAGNGGPHEVLIEGASSGLDADKAIIQNVVPLTLIDDNGNPRSVYKINIDKNLIYKESTGQPSAATHSQRIRYQANGPGGDFSTINTTTITRFSQLNLNPGTDYGFSMSIKRQAQAQTLSSVCNFDPIHNWKFANVSYNDQIQTNPTYPFGGQIGNFNLSTDSNTYSTFEIIWNDGSLIPPTSNNALNPTAGTFKLALGVGERTLVEFENTITASQDDQPLNLMFLNGERVLNFNIDKRITAKNVVDDMLFWSDGVSEPRKININRSISGTDSNGNTHTNLINEEVQPESGYVPIRKEHVTVIRKSPTKPLTVKTVAASSFESSILTISGGSAGDNEFQGGNGDGVSIGESVLISYSIDYGFKTGDVLKIAPSQSDLPNSFDIRVVITNVYSQNDIDADLLNFSWLTSGHKAIRVEVLSITEDAPIDQSQNITWYSYTEKQGKKLFERKLPRFAYRYKYLDNEYSAISPFTDVIFIPGQFDYHPTEAYNKGMVNHLKSLELKDFVSSGMPKDVVQIDLLYKNDTEPNIYLIDSIKPNDNNTNWYENGSLEATWQNVSWGDYFTTGSYNVETENIYATLPSNQTLRPWDNVPKTAIAQEVTGSRLIYGNYTQGYDLAGITPIINVNLQTRSSKDYSGNIGKKSIKSLRSYDIGVVWGDKYGRETPVIAPSSGSLNVPKSRADQSNFINVELQESPSWAHYYKYYIKETSNEYYNLALGRVYVDGEDDNVWLAFPSIDRNKVDEDTYLILKKGIGENSNLITEEARFKIVAIENEAPEQIKTTFTKLLRTNTDASRTPNSCYMYGGASTNSPALPNDGANAPTPGRLNFTIRRDSWENTYDAVGGVDSVAMGLTSPLKILEEVNANPRGLDELYVGFSKEVANESPVFSTKYRVIDVIDDIDKAFYDIKLASPILTEDDFITDSTLINDNIHIHFWKKTIENKPEFDGRFFVKIHKDKDGVVENNLIAAVERVKNWAISAATKVFKIEDTSLTNTHNNEEYSYAGSTSNSSADPKTQAHWNSVLKFGTSSTQGYWFVDKASFAAKQPLNSTDYKNAETTIAGIETCDITSSINSSLNYRHTLTNLEFNLAQVTGASANVGNGKSKGVLGMRGDHQRGGQYYLDLSYSKLEPHGAFGKNSSSNYSWAVGENSATIEEEGIVQSLKENSRFKIAGNDSIYKILGVTKYRLYNYMGKTHVSSGIAEKYSYEIFGVGLSTVRSTLHPTETAMMSRSENRRHTYRIKYELDPTMDPNSPVYTQGNPQGDFPLSSNSSFTPANATTSIELQFLTEFDTEKENKLPSNPAVFETEPKEDLDLNLYYEASSAIPTGPINNTNRYMFAPIGSTIEPLFYNGLDFPIGTFVVGWTIFDGEHAILLSQRLNFAERQILINNGVKIVRDDGSYTSCEVVGNSFGVGPTEISGQADSADRFIVNPTSKTGLGWFNCWSFGNGVESNRIGDTFNKPFITNGVKASATLEEAYTEEHRKYGLIYSGIYNSNSGTNNLNQFIAAEKITKDINPIYGSIQKLYSRSTADGDLITLCEDRILKILANKDAVFNAD